MVRLVFQPLEEVSRTLFAKLQQQAAPSGDKHPRKAVAARVMRAFLVMVRLVVIVGLVIAALGSNYCLVLVHLLLGTKCVAVNVRLGVCVGDHRRPLAHGVRSWPVPAGGAPQRFLRF